MVRVSCILDVETSRVGWLSAFPQHIPVCSSHALSWDMNTSLQNSRGKALNLRIQKRVWSWGQFTTTPQMCVILSWALTQGSVQRNCSIQPKRTIKKMFPKTPCTEIWETTRVSLWTTRNYFFPQTPPLDHPTTPPEFDQDIHKHHKPSIPCWVKWKCGTHKKKPTKKEDPNQLKILISKFYQRKHSAGYWIFLHILREHTPVKKIAKDIITLI